MQPSQTRVLISSCIGSLMEMYDFSLYAFFAPVISHLFFPLANPVVSMIAVFGVFSIGYLMRPLGALLFGHFGDKIGRRKMLLYSVLFMGVPTLLTGCLPTYEQIGVFAPILLIIVRMAQGLSVGSEFAGATVFIGEHADTKRRGFLCSWIIFGIMLGLLIGSGTTAWISHALTHVALYSWGWRVLFFSALIITPIAYYIRRKIPETPIFLEMQEKNLLSKSPLKSLFKENFKSIVMAAGITWVCAACVGLNFVYMSTYLTTVLHFHLSFALLMNSTNMIFLIIMIPIMGALSDRFGRKTLLLIGSIGLILLSYPLFYWLNHTRSAIEILIALFFLSLFSSAILGAFSAAIVELFPSNVRYSGVAISYNVMAGTGPLIASFLIWLTNDPVSPSFYLLFTALISLVFISRMKETAKSKLL